MKSGEVFPNAPLALAAVEVRFPPVSDRSLGIAVHRQIREHLGTDWIIQNDTSQIFEAGLGPGGPQSSLRSETIVRISSRSKTKIITVRPDNFTIEVADYLHYADFRGLLSTVAAAVERVLQPDGVSRIGLRYIDEISVPEDEPHWERWIHSSLIPPTLPPGNGPNEWTGAVQYRLADDRLLVFRFGTSTGPVVSPTGPLRRPRVPNGPIFMFDFDSSWQPAEIPEFSADNIVSVADLLREPLRGLFDSLVLPALVSVFRGNE